MTPAEFKWLARRYAEIKGDAARCQLAPERIVQEIFGECRKIGVQTIEFARAITFNVTFT
ncbi:MAG: hypothetical protein KBF30_01400 [Hyphomonadaceae bacterium]|nr:hypothetical protein [Hyphomonadaceae bacterium]